MGYFTAHLDGGSPSRIYHCQWPNCRDIASHSGHRGKSMPKLYVCDRHLHDLRTQPDPTIHQISKDRQPLRTRLVARGHAPWTLGSGDGSSTQPPTWDQ